MLLTVPEFVLRKRAEVFRGLKSSEICASQADHEMKPWLKPEGLLVTGESHQPTA